MNLLFLDFETYYDREYSLKNMTPAEYIMDPRFEMITVAVDYTDSGLDMPRCMENAQLSTFLKSIDPIDTTTVCFNALFDNCILAWKYGFVPARMLDTMGMARALIGHKCAGKLSLANVAKVLGLPDKGNAIHQVMGMRERNIKQAGLWGDFIAYALNDNELNKRIFQQLIVKFPPEERTIMDLVIRCAVEPRFHLNTYLLQKHLDDIKNEKIEMLIDAGLVSRDQLSVINSKPTGHPEVDAIVEMYNDLNGEGASDETLESLFENARSQLMSGPKFQAALEKLGVQVETKYSKTTGRQIPALARTDEFMLSLCDHPDARVQNLALARLGHKSTIEETRSRKLLAVAELPWNTAGNGSNMIGAKLMPIPLRYGGAHTHRLSGDWGMNMQNLPRSGGRSKLRDALIAPPGSKIITCDLAQIEARLVAWMAKCHTLTRMFAQGEDVYSSFAKSVFGYPVDKKNYPTERFIGKTGVLGLGYGCGENKFYQMVTMMARTSKIDISKVFGTDTAKIAVNAYRRTYREIPSLWYTLDSLIKNALILKNAAPEKVGPVTIEYECVNLPNGMKLMYESPRYDFTTSRTTYINHVGATTDLYGGRLLENIIQALARIIVMHAALRLSKLGYRFVLQAHDELAFIVPDNDVDCAKTIILSEMTRRPSWAVDLPLAAEIGVGQSYGEAK